MKLLECHVDNFGRLSNFDYQFSDGLTVIQEPNGFGKSTLAAFIKAMLYGFREQQVETSQAMSEKSTFRGKVGHTVEVWILSLRALATVCGELLAKRRLKTDFLSVT